MWQCVDIDDLSASAETGGNIENFHFNVVSCRHWSSPDWKKDKHLKNQEAEGPNPLCPTPNKKGTVVKLTYTDCRCSRKQTIAPKMTTGLILDEAWLHQLLVEEVSSNGLSSIGIEDYSKGQCMVFEVSPATIKKSWGKIEDQPSRPWKLVLEEHSLSVIRKF